MNHGNLPSCSLIISTYNWPEALEKSVQSAFNQTVLPDEILIADDGSDERTADRIQKLKDISPIPIIHIWHPDEGFRLGEIRNRAIQQARFAYIIQIDGDILLDSHFIEDHLRMAKPNTFLCGSRVLMDSAFSRSLLQQKTLNIRRRALPLGYVLNSFRIPWLGKLMADRYKRNNPIALRGCNMSFWKKDLLTVNGYNQAIMGWGSEDAELAIRLINRGIKKRFLKFMGLAFHLYHPEKSKANLEKNQRTLKEAMDEGITWIPNGIR